ncbi:Methyltransferase type 11 [Parvibaculum lavamentivorans DS-1]|uniref:Arsenite methyltransferase n=1 Tax=Parvibaculum lavamentivorans (strain DS-1 / DSM 13023 / NCIMB 13966) TaxID=402881 RepID=A7HVJ9_PARL1|nr:methyltransferase domain-containing protein [Parvibaculum lavamentivorans]ABS63932.1 Methyltransferase type 11 [Parvibaculum lavamentivorans DS-1]
MSVESVKEYYGQTLKGSADLKTDACCDPGATPPHIRAALSDIHDDVLTRYYGCGLVIPDKVEGMRVLDLGCGAGRDAYALAKLVGETGSVTGVDMTAEQLAVARAHVSWHMERFGYRRANVDFREGYIERLGELGLEPESFDIIVSNCVINLSPDKRAVLEGARRLLKPGGEFYFADVYADRRLDPSLRDDPVLLGECLGGALYWNDFLTLSKQAGFADPRLVTDRPLEVREPSIRRALGNARFFSTTYRLFKLDALEPACEDYGQAVIYKGGIPHAEDAFTLDAHHRIEKGRVFPVCGNTWHMLKATRFAPHFDFIGDFSQHYGIFEGCGTQMPFGAGGGEAAAGACC